jgi:hypothetical protein
MKIVYDSAAAVCGTLLMHTMKQMKAQRTEIDLGMCQILIRYAFAAFRE